MWAQESQPKGLVAPWHVRSSWTGDWTCVARTGWQILIHATSREAQKCSFILDTPACLPSGFDEWSKLAASAASSEMQEPPLLIWDKWCYPGTSECTVNGGNRASLGSPGQLTWWPYLWTFQGCTFFSSPREEGLTDVSSSLGPFAGDGTAGCMTSFRPQTQFCLELSNTPFDDGVPFPSCSNSRGLATPLAIPAAVPLWTVGWVTSVACMTLVLVMVSDMSGHLHVTEELT